MGSFANSLHVKCDRGDAVLAAVHDIFRDRDWRPTDQPPDDDAPLGMESDRRALHISASAGGWVSLLDSDLLATNELAEQLAAKLATPTIYFLVNDSDSWGYRLVDPQGNVSEHFPDEEDGEDDFSEDDLAGLGDKLATLQNLMHDGSLPARMAEVSERMWQAAPPEIAALRTRLESGQATMAEMQQYQAWALQEMPKHQDQIHEMLGGLLGFASAPPRARAAKAPAKPTRAEKAAQRKRLKPLRALAAAGVTDEQLQAALDARAVFAEETLAAFLPLLGIAPHYAYLDYRSLSETTPHELAAQNIRFVHHLKFESAS